MSIFYECIRQGVDQAMAECQLTIGMTLREAVEKQIPQKVTHEASLLKCCTCPRCKNVVDCLRIKEKYCHFCGQALDWEE